MKKGNTLVNTLYWFSNISFYFLILLFVTGLAFQIFTEDGKVGNLSVGNHHSVGYPVPVSIAVKPQNPMFNNLLFKVESEGTNVMGKKYSSGTLHHVKPIMAEDSLNFETVVSIHNRDMEDSYELTTRVFRGDGYVNVKPKKFLQKIIILFRVHINFILLIVVFYFLKIIFKTLAINFKFTKKLYKSIKILGLVLILKVLLMISSNFVLGMDLSYINIEPLDYNLQYVNISMNPRLDFDFTTLLIGFSLIVFSFLLKTGKELQQENDLTI